MSDENQTIDPILSENLSDVSTADPLIAKNRYEVEIVKVTQARNSRDTGNLLKFEFKLTQPTTSVDGQPIPAGRRVFHNMSITPTEKMDLAAIQRNLKRFMVCFVKDYKGGIAPLDQWTGLTGIVSIGPAKTTEEYPEPKSEIKAFEPKK